MQQPKTIGVLTSGGDAPGMNACVRAVVRTAQAKGLNVIGVERGYNGLLTGACHPLGRGEIAGILQYGGTVLHTARCMEFKTEQGQQKAAETCRRLGIDGLVVIGGDGSFMGAQALCRHGISCIGVPGTIDNDIACTDYTIGYDTAMNTAMEMIDRLRDSDDSHDCCSVVEVMGHHAGHLAMNVGIATGAISVLLPESGYDFERDILAPIRLAQAAGKQYFIILVSEFVTDTQALAKQIEKVTGVHSRASILGHVQRGGSPTARDRVLASGFGYRAVELLAAGQSNRVVGYVRGEMVDYPIDAALAMQKQLDPFFYNVAKTICI